MNNELDIKSVIGEIWKLIDGYENYEVSNFGRVRCKSCKQWNGKNFFNKKEKILKYRFTKAGYARVNLYQNGIGTDYYVHRLVAKAFLPNPENFPEINHKDENKGNNRVDNLEWCTAKYNINFGTAIRRRTLKKIGKTINNKSVAQYGADGTLVQIYKSVTEARQITGIDNSYIGKVANGKAKIAGGYIWRWC